MSQVSLSVAISPVGAESAGCSASCTGEQTDYENGWSRAYTATATEVSGWRFVKFEWYTTRVTQSGSDAPVYHDSPYNPSYSSDGLSESRTEHTASLWTESRISGLTAVFEQTAPTTYTVSTAAKYAAGGTVTGGGTYAAGTTITLTATPNQGYKFSGWKSSAGDTESSPSFSYTVNSDVTWTAFFGTWRLIYFDRAGSGIDIPGDAIVTIDFDPKSGNSLTVSPSWAPSTSLTAQGTVALPKTTLDSVNNLTMGLAGSAGMSAAVVIQQRNVASFAYQNSLQQGVSVTMNINVSDGKITGVS